MNTVPYNDQPEPTPKPVEVSAECRRILPIVAYACAQFHDTLNHYRTSVEPDDGELLRSRIAPGVYALWEHLLDAEYHCIEAARAAEALAKNLVPPVAVPTTPGQRTKRPRAHLDIK